MTQPLDRVLHCSVGCSVLFCTVLYCSELFRTVLDFNVRRPVHGSMGIHQGLAEMPTVRFQMCGQVGYAMVGRLMYLSIILINDTSTLFTYIGLYYIIGIILLLGYILALYTVYIIL